MMPLKKAVKKILSNCPDYFSRQDENGNTLWHRLLMNTQINYDMTHVEFLMYDLKVPFNIQNKEGKSPLHLAAYMGHVMLVHKLIQMAVDTNRKDNKGYKPSDYGCAIEIKLFNLVRKFQSIPVYPFELLSNSKRTIDPTFQIKLAAKALENFVLNPDKNTDVFDTHRELLLGKTILSEIIEAMREDPYYNIKLPVFMKESNSSQLALNKYNKN